MPSRKNFPDRVEARRARARERQNAVSHGSTAKTPSMPQSYETKKQVSPTRRGVLSLLGDSFWPIYVYLILSIVIAGSVAIKVSWVPALWTIIASFLSLVAGGGLKASVLWGDKAQKIGGAIVALLIAGLAQWAAESFSVGLFGNHIDGDLWCWIGFAVGLIFTSRKLAGAKPRVTAAPTGKSSAELLGELGELMERYPFTALLDTSRLPAPKQKLKAVIKEVWKTEPKLRNELAQAYLYLSHFQDGIGDVVLECKLPNRSEERDRRILGGTASAHDLEVVRQEAREIAEGPTGENFRQWLMWEKVSQSEMEILIQEWASFQRG